MDMKRIEEQVNLWGPAEYDRMKKEDKARSSLGTKMTGKSRDLEYSKDKGAGRGKRRGRSLGQSIHHTAPKTVMRFLRSPNGEFP